MMQNVLDAPDWDIASKISSLRGVLLQRGFNNQQVVVDGSAHLAMPAKKLPSNTSIGSCLDTISHYYPRIEHSEQI